MKRVYVNEKWCLGCHLCEYYCAFANSGKSSMVKALKDHKIAPRIRIEGATTSPSQYPAATAPTRCASRAASRGALTIVDGAVQIDSGKCVGCSHLHSVLPYGALSTSSEGAIQKCELCAKNAFGQPMCVQGCPNKAIVYEER
ncbi:MAG: 4Fe-4S dicluster domain-containing protein [Butyricicoccaceae bacterium]